MVFEKGLKVNNSRWDKVVRKLSKHAQIPNSDDYKLGQRMKEDEEDDRTK